MREFERRSRSLYVDSGCSCEHSVHEVNNLDELLPSDNTDGMDHDDWKCYSEVDYGDVDEPDQSNV